MGVLSIDMILKSTKPKLTPNCGGVRFSTDFSKMNV